MLTYPVGTDNLGRDVLSRLIYGAQISLLISFFAIVIAGAVGVVLGLTAGYIGGWIDALFMRTVAAFLAIPFILMARGFVPALGTSLTHNLTVMGITNRARSTRLVRCEVSPVRTPACASLPPTG